MVAVVSRDNQRQTMSGGEEQNTSGTGTVNQAHRTTQIPLPGKFEEANSPQAADAWPKWLRRFDRHRAASELNSKPSTEQVSTLLYAMGAAPMIFSKRSD